MRFRPCIDLHDGEVKQIVGGTLTDGDDTSLHVNFVSAQPPAYYAALYRRDHLPGGHVIMLGPGSEAAAREALEAWPGGMQLGGGVNAGNAGSWLEAGASHVIVTSYVFREGRIDWERLAKLRDAIGPDQLVLDLSCRREADQYIVVTDRWQRFTHVALNADSLGQLGQYCAEFLVHAADVEGLCRGVDEALVSLLARDSPVPVTYAGGAASMGDLHLVERAGEARVDVTVGSALDLFGGSGIRYDDVVAFHRARNPV